MTIVVFPVYFDMTEDAHYTKKYINFKGLRISSNACVRQTCTCNKKSSRLELVTSFKNVIDYICQLLPHESI